MENDLLKWLQEWYLAQCGDERDSAINYNHERDKDKEMYQWSHGISIETLDNPGWKIEIDLSLTDLQNKPFATIGLYDTWDDEFDNDWYSCYVQDGKFCGHSGPLYLFTMIEIFKKWAQE